MIENNPTFYMLIGLPGSGKTYFSSILKEKISNVEILSSDEIRKELFGSAEQQTDHQMVFNLMQKRAIEYLKAGKSVIYDATNILRKHRKHTLSLLPPCQKIAITVFSRYEDCIERDKARNRSVSSSVIKRMILHYQPPYYDEGWDEIFTHINGSQYTNENYLDWMNCTHDNPHHNNSVAEHTQKVCELAFVSSCEKLQTDYIGAFQNAVIGMAAAVHDIGKKFTKSFINARGEKTDIAHFYNHQNVGSYFATGLENLNVLDLKDKLAVIWLVSTHMEPFFKSKYYLALPSNLKSLIDELHRYDTEGA